MRYTTLIAAIATFTTTMVAHAEYPASAFSYPTGYEVSRFNNSPQNPCTNGQFSQGPYRAGSPTYSTNMWRGTTYPAANYITPALGYSADCICGPTIPCSSCNACLNGNCAQCANFSMQGCLNGSCGPQQRRNYPVGYQYGNGQYSQPFSGSSRGVQPNFDRHPVSTIPVQVNPYNTNNAQIQLQSQSGFSNGMTSNRAPSNFGTGTSVNFEGSVANPYYN